MDRILEAIQEGRKLDAVKIYKDNTGKSLLESKDFIEALIAQLEIAEPSAVGNSGCILLLVIAVGLFVLSFFV